VIKIANILKENEWRSLQHISGGKFTDFKDNPASLVEELGAINYATQTRTVTEFLQLDGDILTRKSELSLILGISSRGDEPCTDLPSPTVFASAGENGMAEDAPSQQPSAPLFAHVHGSVMLEHTDDPTLASPDSSLEIFLARVKDFQNTIAERQSGKVDIRMRPKDEDAWSSISREQTEDWISRSTADGRLKAILRDTKTDRYEPPVTQSTTLLLLELVDEKYGVLEINMHGNLEHWSA